MRSMLNQTASLTVLLLLIGSTAHAQERGRTSFGFNGSLGISGNDQSTDTNLQAVLQFSGTRYLSGGHLELGVALTWFSNGTFTTESSTGSSTLNPNLLVRLNTSPLGKNDDLILYIGGTVGASILSTSSPDGTITSTSASWGGQLGMNHFLATNVALNVQMDYQLSEADFGLGAVQTYNFTGSLGARFFF